VCPQELAGFPVKGNHRSPRAPGRVQHAIDRERRAFELVFRTRSKHIGLEPPRDFELIEVRGIDFRER